MPTVPIGIKNRRKKRSGLFSTDNVDLNRKEFRRYITGARRTSRFIFSWMALMLGLFFTYTSLHYVPSLMGDSIFAVTHSGSAKGTLDDRRYGVLTPYFDLLHLKRGHFAEGQKMTVQYNLPRGASANLIVTQCQSLLVLEVFHCNPVGTTEFTVDKISGAKTVAVGAAGFYMVDSTVAGADNRPYRIVWSRS